MASASTSPRGALPLMVGAAIVASVPTTCFAELSNDALFGAGLRARPAYDGSAAQRSEAVPVLRWFGTPWFARSTQGVFEGGLRTELGPGLHAGAQLAYEPGRRSDESAFLAAHDMPDIGQGASTGLHLEWDHTIGPMPFTALARARKHIDAKRGGQADVRLSAGVFRNGPLSAGVFGQATWADARSADTSYGISAARSASAGLPAFTPRSGWTSASGGLMWSVAFGQHGLAVGSLERRRLQGDAARSPLAERNSGHYVTAGLAYRL